MEYEKLKRILWISLLNVLLFVGLLFAYNEIVRFNFQQQLLLKPCELCLEANPHIKNCVEDVLRTNTNNQPMVNFTLPMVKT